MTRLDYMYLCILITSAYMGIVATVEPSELLLLPIIPILGICLRAIIKWVVSRDGEN